MKRSYGFLWPTLILMALISLVGLKLIRADDFKFSSRLKPSDYLLGSQEQHRDPVFDKYRTVELGVNLGVGSDCGRIDFKTTLQSSLQNILDTKYFGSMGRDILAGSPMLLTCYFSPTWCAILKHSQVSAHWLSQLRLDQCSIIDKYTDSRVDDFYQERQSCVRKSIDKNGGNLEQALERCSGNNVWKGDLANWAGNKSGEKASINRLIESSAKWAGMDGPESKDTLGLLKSFVGDTVVSRGNVSVEYGPRQTPLTPGTYLQSLEKATYSKLCLGLVHKIEEAGDGVSLDRVIHEEDLKGISPNTDQLLVDRQTLRSLAYMSSKQRSRACKKLSDAIALTVFSTDVNRALDVLTTLSQNPNLPPNRKQEIETKRKALKDQIEMTVSLQRERNDPVNTVLSQINSEGQALQSEAVRAELSTDEQTTRTKRLQSDFMDCSDPMWCQKGSE